MALIRLAPLVLLGLVSAQNGNLREHNTTLPTGPGLVASAAFVGFNITVRLSLSDGLPTSKLSSPAE